MDLLLGHSTQHPTRAEVRQCSTCRAEATDRVTRDLLRLCGEAAVRRMAAEAQGS